MRLASLALLSLSLSVVGCTPFSESVRDETVGFNGGFEETRSALPVNWQVYSPATIRSGDYELIVDRTDFREGRQSLRFLVHECSDQGGRHSPGMTRETPAIPGEDYRISFWIKNEGTRYRVNVRGVAPKTGAEHVLLDSSEERSTTWKRVEQVYTMPEEYETLRFELSILAPGSLWIDGVSVERVKSEDSQDGTV